MLYNWTTTEVKEVVMLHVIDMVALIVYIVLLGKNILAWVNTGSYKQRGINAILGCIGSLWLLFRYPVPCITMFVVVFVVCVWFLSIDIE